jgi:hypothetical protein
VLEEKEDKIRAESERERWEKNKMSIAKVRDYDPLLCKTCQVQKRISPNAARVHYSDCDEHFRQRMKRLVLIGGVYYAK